MLTIPSWLIGFLDKLNWDILTWHVYVGDSVKAAIQWVLDLINTLIDWAGKIGAFIAELIQEIRDAFAVVTEYLETLWQWFLNWLDIVGDYINNWWLGVQDTVKGWIQVAQDFVLDIINTIRETVDRVSISLEEFFGSILPTLARLVDIEAIFISLLSPFRDLFAFWGDRAREILEFFNDPFEFINIRLTRWLDSFLRRYL